jgi:hypothetical protein
MSDLDPCKLHVTFKATKTLVDLILPRRYTLTHSDRTGELFLTIADDYDYAQISGWYTRLMRDEVLAEWQNGSQPTFHVYCHVSGGVILGSARWRYSILKNHMPMVLQAFRHGDQELFFQNPDLDSATISVHFSAKQIQLNKIEIWGTFADYVLEASRSK